MTYLINLFSKKIIISGLQDYRGLIHKHSICVGQNQQTDILQVCKGSTIVMSSTGISTGSSLYDSYNNASFVSSNPRPRKDKIVILAPCQSPASLLPINRTFFLSGRPLPWLEDIFRPFVPFFMLLRLECIYLKLICLKI